MNPSLEDPCLHEISKKHEALSPRLADRGRCQLRDGRSEDQGAFMNRFAMSPPRAVLPSPSASAPLPSRRDLPTNRRLVTHGTRSPPDSSHRRSQWSSEEEDALRKGVEKYGSGKWRFIQKDAHLSKILHQRSNVDLKVRRSPTRDVPFSSGRSDEKKCAPADEGARREARDAPPLHSRTSDTCLAPFFLHDRINGGTCTPGSIPREGRTRCVSRRLSVPAIKDD